MGKIVFNYNSVPPIPGNKESLKRFLTNLLKTEKTDFEKISYVFCKDEYLIELNKEYLNHDTFTDILTFKLSSDFEPLISELYISIERVRENAKNLNVGFRNELLRVIIHGALHLCGYNDHSKDEKVLMRAKEDYYLSLYCFT